MLVCRLPVRWLRCLFVSPFSPLPSTVVMEYLVTVSNTALIEIIGVNGEEWTVSGEGMGDQGVILDNDPEGLFDEAPWTGIWQQGATQQGATLMGVSEDPIDLVLTFKAFGSDDGMPYEEVEARFFQSFDKVKEATIRVTTTDGSRTLKVVKLEQSQLKSAKDPRLGGYSTTILTLRAGWPFWEGDTITSTFLSGTTRVSSGEIIVSNPTDVPIYPKWVVSAPGRWTLPDHDFEDTSGDIRTIELAEQSSSRNLTIDTYPREETYVVSDGSNFAGRMGGVDFLYPIPPRTKEMRLPVSVTGGYEMPGSGGGSSGGSSGSGSSSGSGVFAVRSVQIRMVQHWMRPAGKVYN